MLSILHLLASGAALAVAYYLLLHRPKSFISKLPGPNSSNFLFGNMMEIHRNECGSVHKKWFAEYGPVIRYYISYGKPRLATIDPKALNHILVKHSYEYPKPENVRKGSKAWTGEGIVYAEGDVHKRQRRLLNVTFAPAQMRAIAPLVFKVAYQLSSMWKDLLVESDGNKKPYVKIDAMDWINRATLDIIGLAAFDYNFEALEKEGNSEMANSFSAVVEAESEYAESGPLNMFLMGMIQKFPFLPDSLRSKRAAITKHSQDLMRLESMKALIKAQNEDMEQRKDFISLLVRAAKAEKGTREEMSDEEVLGQMATFILAGHETTATSLSWQFWTLAKNPRVQEKLREELLDAVKHCDKSAAADGIPISIDELQALPYLDAFLRESLRLYPAIFEVMRAAAHDDQIPLSKPVRTESGDLIDSLPIRAGETILIPIPAFNRSKEMFGENAEEFDPERWLQGEVENTRIGAWSSLLTFLAGPRACIGYRFALLEMKAILLVLLTKFKFEERDEGGGPEIQARGSAFMKPWTEGENKGGAMPLRISLVEDL